MRDEEGPSSELWSAVQHELESQQPILDECLQRGGIIQVRPEKLTEEQVLEVSNKELTRTIQRISKDMDTNK